MRCVTAKEVADLFGSIGFKVTTNTDLRRMALELNREFAGTQRRIGGPPTPETIRLPQFSAAINRWLPSNEVRLLWTSHCSAEYPSTYDLFVAARLGLGDSRTWFEAPGHLFDSFPYGELDQLLISSAQARQTGILIGLMSFFMTNGWDGWLIAGDTHDRIEFWEGNILFYSETMARLDAAKSLMVEFNCSQQLI